MSSRVSTGAVYNQLGTFFHRQSLSDHFQSVVLQDNSKFRVLRSPSALIFQHEKFLGKPALYLWVFTALDSDVTGSQWPKVDLHLNAKDVFYKVSSESLRPNIFSCGLRPYFPAIIKRLRWTFILFLLSSLYQSGVERDSNLYTLSSNWLVLSPTTDSIVLTAFTISTSKSLFGLNASPLWVSTLDLTSIY